MASKAIPFPHSIVGLAYFLDVVNHLRCSPIIRHQRWFLYHFLFGNRFPIHGFCIQQNGPPKKNPAGRCLLTELYRKFYKSEHFVCPNCGHCWKPPVRKLVFSVNAVEGKILRCPQCSEKVYVEPVPDKTAK